MHLVRCDWTRSKRVEVAMSSFTPTHVGKLESYNALTPDLTKGAAEVKEPTTYGRVVGTVRLKDSESGKYWSICHKTDCCTEYNVYLIKFIIYQPKKEGDFHLHPRQATCSL